METSTGYQVNLEIFQGPLDLLLFLIKKKKIEIQEIPIATITKEYLNYLDQKEKINLEREAEFLLMAALLIYIKSQMLLPRETLPEEEDPRQILVDKLQDYQRIKAACLLLREKEQEQQKKWMRTTLPFTSDEPELELAEVSLFDLAEAFFALMQKKEREDIRIIKGSDISVEKKMEEMLHILQKDTFFDFLDYFNQQETIEEALASFFCLLELIKAKIAIAVQENLFHSIKVWLRKEIKR